MGSVERTREIRRRRARKVKLVKLRKLYEKSANEGEKAQLLAKARKVSPLFSFEVAAS
ncbi:MAG: hypothetical protein JWM11_2566 [Planctomycetaceae bacterium]|nr:hypothetical protein [Planctomycetaceae bacterium]